MDKAEIFRMIQETLFETDLYKASLAADDEKAAHYSEKLGREILKYETVKTICEKHGLNPEHVYFTDKLLTPYVYYDFPVFFELIMDEKYLKIFKLREYLQIAKQKMTKALEEGNYQRIFEWSDKKAYILLLKELFPKIPDHEKFGLFLDIYTSLEYGFSRMPKEMIEEAFRKRTEKERKETRCRLDEKFPGEILTIYRGVSTLSTPPEKAYSWTLSPGVAAFFASRFEKGGKVYVGKIKKDDVVAYVDSRGEEEILVWPGTVHEIELLETKKTEDIIQMFSESGLFDDFYSYLAFLNKRLFETPDGIHGYLHAKRVLLHAMVLSHFYNFSEKERTILALAALYHDIGRENDLMDDAHGAKSWEKLTKEGNLLKKITHYFSLSAYDLELLRFIIENHCLDDETIRKKTEETDIPNYSKKVVLFLMNVFKDADGLDRVRLRDLKVEYLRTDEAKKMLIFANDVWHGLR